MSAATGAWTAAVFHCIVAINKINYEDARILLVVNYGLIADLFDPVRKLKQQL